MSDRVGLAKVAEDENAEQFMILIDDAEERRRLDYTDLMDETMARAELAAMGESEMSIAAMLQRARERFEARHVGPCRWLAR